MKSRTCRLVMAAFAALVIVAPVSAAAEAAPSSPPASAPKDGNGKDKKKNKNKDGSKKKDKNKDSAKKKDKDGTQDNNKDSTKKKDKDGAQDNNKDSAKKKDKDKKKYPSDAKGGLTEPAAEPATSTNGNWCEWLSNNPGTVYSNKNNPWLQGFRIGGRLQYQAIYQDGEDLYGREYHDAYDEYRRFRLETRTKFLRFFSGEFDVNLVNDNRFKSPPGNELDWGYDDFDTAMIECDLRKAFSIGFLDELSLAYGKMKMPITEEQRQSSKSIYTIERSLLSDKLAGAESRPTGALLQAGKGEWSGRIGFFSGEDDADFLGAWNDGTTQFYSLTWQPSPEFHLTLDYATTHQSGTDDALGYRSAVVLGSTYETKRWGTQASLIYGDNGYGDPEDSAKNRENRQGDFYGATVMPWYWLVKDRLQLVGRYEYAASEESEGIRLSSRYIRAAHDDPNLTLNSGRGDRYDAWYLGLNYYLCGDNAKIMAGVLYEALDTHNTYRVKPKGKPNYDATDFGTIKAFTYVIAFRTSF